MTDECKIRCLLAAFYLTGCLIVYAIGAFLMWDVEPGFGTRFGWVVWTFIVIGWIVESKPGQQK